MRLREIIEAEGEGTKPTKKATSPKAADRYQSRPPKRSRYQDGGDGSYQELPDPVPAPAPTS